LFGELPKIFGRAFAIGYVMPSILLIMLLDAVLNAFQCEVSALQAITSKDTAEIAILLSAIALISIFFLSLNRELIKLICGIGFLNPLRIMRLISITKFRTVKKRREDLRARRSKLKGTDQFAFTQSKWISLSLKLAHEFPDSASALLATGFGNIIGAAEAYPRVVYGIDSTFAFARLFSVIPKEYASYIEDEKAQIDFWVNTLYRSVLTLCFYGALAFQYQMAPNAQVIIPIALLVALSSYQFAKYAASRWGLLFMSSFDLYRSDLAKKLDLSAPGDLREEREMWQLASQVWIYRSAVSAEKLDKFRTKEKDKGEKNKAEKEDRAKEDDDVEKGEDVEEVDESKEDDEGEGKEK
jgi:hypothetical protein